MILHSNAFLICTLPRGVIRGEPYLVGHERVREVELEDGTVISMWGLDWQAWISGQDDAELARRVADMDDEIDVLDEQIWSCSPS